ncbi:hypothetical protein [Natrononativus amylolyticus]|uniref:hypothetical protein n=1 Tax=Natrononativus amylolyticus TaxID=2963434 RepID=UPI0020CC41F8|nr:hypothetical protein [Natrononativus amylolyticus]
MSTFRATAFVVVVAVLGLTVAPIASAAVVTGVTDEPSDNDSDEPRETSMGTEISEFMQTSAAGADHAVDTRMFDAAYENAPEDRRGEIVSDRTSHLEQRLTSLEREYAEIEEREEEMNPAAYEARLTRLAVQISALENAIDQAEPRANESGVGTDAIVDLRTNAMSLATSEITTRAGDLIGIEFSLGQGDAAPGQGDTPPGQSGDTDAGGGGGETVDGDGVDGDSGGTVDGELDVEESDAVESENDSAESE